jgi:SAM-dependent methyltransferase
MDVIAKLQIKPGQRVATLAGAGEVPVVAGGGANPCAAPDTADAIVAFVRSRTELGTVAGPAVAAARCDKLAWIAYPQAGRLGTDLTRDILAAALAGEGIQPVCQVTLDETWSALRFRPAAVHLQRRVAESFGTDAERYDRARPSYPAALVDRIVGVSPGPDVLDAGCGTGICARLFQAAGCRVLGVDPDPRMAELAIRSGVPVDVATLEEWEPAGRTFDAVVAGQAWHWVDPVAGAAKAAAVLRPGGRLTVFWNAFGFPPELRGIFGSIYRRVVPGSPLGGFFARPAVDTYLVMGTRAADGMTAAGGFGPPERWRFDWERAYTRAQWLDVVPTLGGQGQLPPAMLAELLEGMGSAIDAAGGSFTMNYVTVAVSAARAGHG